MRIVCISDTHEFHDELVLPQGDLLIHAGDFTLELFCLAQIRRMASDIAMPLQAGCAGEP